MLQKFLMIGLGGSGGVTLRYTYHELGRRLREAEWDEGMPDAWQFLHVDVKGEPGDFKDETPRALEGENNFLGLAKSPRLYRSHDQEVMRNAAIVPGTVGWRPNPDAVTPEVYQGAGQRRAVGRFITVKELDKIRGRVRRMVEKMDHGDTTSQLRRLNDRLGDDRDRLRQPRVFVVASLGGGSGSGAFLDVHDLLRTMASGNSPWLQHGISVLYAPDVFASEEERPGVNPNSLAALSEFIAAYEHTGELDPREQALLDPAGGGSTIHGTRSTPYNLFIGKSNDGGITYKNSEEVYRAVGTTVAAFMTNADVQLRFDDYLIANYREHAPATDLGIEGKEPGGGNAASSFGYATVGLGSRLFTEYSAQRLAKAAVKRLREGHMLDRPPAERLNEQQVIDRRVKALKFDFFTACGLYELDLQHNQILDALRGLGAEAWADREGTAVQEQLNDRVAAQTGQMPPATWKENFASDLDDIRDSFLAGEHERRLKNGRKWVASIQQDLKAATASLLGREGGAVTLACLEALDQQLEAAKANLEKEAHGYRSDIGTVSDAIGQFFEGLRERRINGKHASIREAIDKGRRLIVRTSEADLRDLAGPVIEDLRSGVVQPLKQSLSDALNALEFAVSEGDERRDVGTWPDGWPSPHLKPAPNDVLLLPFEKWEKHYGTLLVDTFPSDDDLETGTRDAEIMAIGELVSGLWVRAADPESDVDQDLIDQPGKWAPENDNLRESVLGPRSAVFTVDLGPLRLLERSKDWLKHRRGAFAKELNQTLADYLSPDSPEVSQRAQAFNNALKDGLLRAHPLITWDAAHVASVHPGTNELSRWVAMDRIPIGPGHPAYERACDALGREGVEEDQLDRYFAVGTEKSDLEISTFISGSIHPMAFDSVTRSIVEDWNDERNGLKRRQKFWNMRRSRPLTSFIPLDPEGQESMARGWLVAGLLGRIGLPDFRQVEDPDPVTIWTTRGVLEFPKFLLGKQLEDVPDVFPALMETLPLAMISHVRGTEGALAAYEALHQLGDDIDPLVQWIKDGVVQTGAPTVPIEAFEGLDEMSTAAQRRDAVVKDLTDLETMFHELREQEITPAFTLHPDRAWEVAPLIIEAARDVKSELRGLAVDDPPDEPTRPATPRRLA